ncbi:predicted GPI-anchored protein 58, partial [Fopius arisanus]|uniref:Predicted GPI-anchored protein 58 n=1 Tax=Fopius arisanus TaxID=64838 RepID=A0A9R1UAK4_9HYME
MADKNPDLNDPIIAELWRAFVRRATNPGLPMVLVPSSTPPRPFPQQVVQDSGPLGQDHAPLAQHPVPVAQDAAPVAQDPAPAAQDPPPAAQDCAAVPHTAATVPAPPAGHAELLGALLRIEELLHNQNAEQKKSKKTKRRGF